MDKLILNYRAIKSSETLFSKDDCTLTAQKELRWDGANPGDKKRVVVLNVSGRIRDRQYDYQDEWQFEISLDDVQMLEDGIMMLVPKEDGFKTSKPDMDEYIDVYPFLRVGHITEKEVESWYMEFQNNGLKIKIPFLDLQRFKNVRDFFFVARSQ